jgi:hypothetical protein
MDKIGIDVTPDGLSIAAVPPATHEQPARVDFVELPHDPPESAAPVPSGSSFEMLPFILEDDI